MKIRFGDIRWPEIEEILGKTNVVILPIGATEQHGRHLPVNFDYYSVTYYAEQVAIRVTDENNIHVLVTPTIPYGEALGLPPFEKLLPGTISISAETVISLVEDVVRSLVIQGFKNILVLNGHLENTAPIAVALRKVNIDFKDAGLYATNSLLLAQETWKEICQGERADQGHSGERETAIAIAIESENVQLGVTYEGSHISPLPAKYVTPLAREIVFYRSRVGGVRDSGVHLENPCVATEETGEKIIAAVVDELTEIVVAIAKSESMTHKEKV